MKKGWDDKERVGNVGVRIVWVSCSQSNRWARGSGG